MKNNLLLKISIISILFIISLIINNINIFIILISIVSLYKMYCPVISTLIFDSKMLCSILILFCYVTLLQCTILISWLINKNFPLNLTPALMLFIILIMNLFKIIFYRAQFNKTVKSVARKAITFHDIISILISFILCLVIFIMPLKDALGSGYEKQTLVMSLVNNNVDDVSHLALVNDRLQFNRGVLLDSDVVQKTRTQGFYPAGWHSISAILIRMFWPNITVGINSLIAYGIQNLFWFFVLFYLLIRGTLSIYALMNNKKLNIISTVFVSGLSTLFGITFLIPIISRGFYSFTPQLISTLLTLMIIIQLFSNRNRNKSSELLPLLITIGVAGCLPWFLPTPAFFLTVLISIIYISNNINKSKIFKKVLSIVKSNFILIFIVSLASFTQLYIMINNDGGESISLLNGLSIVGNVAIYNENIFILLNIGYFACYILFGIKIKKIMNSALFLITPLLVLCAIIYMAQMINGGSTQYYYYKILDILIICIIPLCTIGYSKIADKISIYSNFFSKIFVSIFIFFGIFLSLGPQSPIFVYLGGNRIFSNEINNSIYNELKNNISEDNYFSNKLVFYYVPDEVNNFENRISNIIMKSNEPDGICFENIRSIIINSIDINLLLDTYKNDCKGKDVTIITNEKFYIMFKNAVIRNNLNNTVSIKKY